MEFVCEVVVLNIQTMVAVVEMGKKHMRTYPACKTNVIEILVELRLR